MRNRRNLRRLSKWVFDRVEKGLWPDHDLHIDEVYGKSDKGDWMKQGMRLLELATGLVNQSKFQVVLIVPLKEIESGTEERVVFESLGAEDLSWTPPSLHIVARNNSAWMTTLSEENRISAEKRRRVFLSKSVEDGMMYRWVYVVLT